MVFDTCQQHDRDGDVVPPAEKSNRPTASVIRALPIGNLLMALLLVGGLAATAAGREATELDEHRSTVGYPGLIEQLVIDGPQLQAKPIDDRRQPIMLRILETFEHGSAYRYDLEYIGLEPGSYNLGNYLEPADAAVSDWKPPQIKVQINPILPAGQVEPSKLAIPRSRFSSFYLAAIVVGCVLWLAGLFLILFYGRGKLYRPELKRKEVTVADRLKPLLEQATTGQLSVNEQAELERVLVAFWRKKLRLAHLSAKELRNKLRGHPDAGQMLAMIDRWLHQPPSGDEFDIDKLVEPYRSLSMEEV